MKQTAKVKETGLKIFVKQIIDEIYGLCWQDINSKSIYFSYQLKFIKK